jgi:hypothetical protein
MAFSSRRLHKSTSRSSVRLRQLDGGGVRQGLRGEAALHEEAKGVARELGSKSWGDLIWSFG